MLFLFLINKLYGYDCYQPIEHCLSCDSYGDYCEKCEDGYSSTYYTCEKCNDKCKQCLGTEEYQCTECYDGYYMDGYDSYYGGSCIPCSDDLTCSKCEQSRPYKCTECIKNYFLDKTTNKCLPCHPSCETCSGTEENQCLTCNEGYFQLGNACKPCGPNCTKCENEDKCIACEEQTFLDDSNRCQKCDSTCKKCHGTSINECDDCYDGFYLNNGLCRSCDPSCKTCKDDRNFCTSCKDGKYYDSGNHACLDCDKECKTCKKAGECETCADGYYKQYANDDCHKCDSSCATCEYFQYEYEVYCTSCPAGYYSEPYTYIKGATRCKKSNVKGCLVAISYSECQTCMQGYYKKGKGCEKCDESCLTCDSADKCSTCEIGFYLDDDSKCTKCSTNCVDCESATKCNQCIENYYISDGICKKCDESCKSCKDETNACTDCADGYIFNEFKRCIKCTDNCRECQDETHCKTCVSEFFIEKDGSCSPCAEVCYECTGPTADDCIECDPGYYISSSLKKCFKCNEACTVCDGPNDYDCTECAPGYFLNKDVDISPSKIGNKCTKCENGCKKCTSTTRCTECQDGYYFTNENCEHCSLGCKNCSTGTNKCTECFDGYYISSNDGSFVNCSRCPAGCDSCSKDDSGRLTCNTCFDGYYFKDKRCNKCTSPCATCTSETECKSCIKGHLLEGNSCNSLCSSSCASCENKADSCTDCNDGFILNGTVCLQCPTNCKTCEIEGESSSCTSCLEGFYLDKGQCKACYFECATCFDSTRYCYTCKEGFYKYTQHDQYYNGFCEECSEGTENCVKCTSDFPEGSLVFTCLECANGFFLKDNKCEPCHSTCKTCDGISEQNCLTCNDEFFFVDGKCLKCSDSCLTCSTSPTTCASCKSHQYLVNGQCLDCDQSCAECSDSNTCTKCPESHFLHEGKCLNSCKELGDEWGSNSDNECVKCNLENCKQYDDKCKCTSCNEGYYYVFDSITSVEFCRPCKLDNCKACNGPEINDCTECKHGYELHTDQSTNKICKSSCDDGYYLDSNNKCQKCNSPCKICSGINGSICNQCEDGYFLNNNVCGFFPTDCEQNKHCENENKGDKPVQIVIEITKFDSFKNEQSGGALRIVNCGLTGENITFNDCKSENGGGGAVFIFNNKNIDQKVSLKNIKFDSCKAAYGGAVYVFSIAESPVVIESCSFINNEVYSSNNSGNKLFGGSAIYLTVKNGAVGLCNFVSKRKLISAMIKVTENFDEHPDELKILNSNNAEVFNSIMIKQCSFKLEENSNSSLDYFVEKQTNYEIDTKKRINNKFIEFDVIHDKNAEDKNEFVVSLSFPAKILMSISSLMLVVSVILITIKKRYQSYDDINNDSIDSINA